MYDKIFDYDNSNFTIAYKNNKAGLIDVNSGKPLTEFIYDIVEDTINDMLNDLLVLEDNNSKPSPFCAMLAGISKDYCTMSKNQKWGLLDKNGKVVFDFKYKYPIQLLNKNRYNSGYYIVNIDGFEGVLDENSNIIIEPVYDHIMESKNYWCCEKNNREGLADINGHFVTEIKYPSICAASSTRPCFIARKGFLSGLITLNDKIIFDFNYMNLKSENDGEFYIGTLKGKYGVINYEGKIVLNFKYDHISVCTNKNNKVAFLVRYKDKQELLDENGEKLWN